MDNQKNSKERTRPLSKRLERVSEFYDLSSKNSNSKVPYIQSKMGNQKIQQKHTRLLTKGFDKISRVQRPRV